MPSTLAISFGHSRSLTYDTLVELAQEFDTYQVTGAGAKLRHTVTVSGEEILDQPIGTLLDFCRELKSTRIRINGRLIGRTEMWQLHLTRLPPIRRCWDRNGEHCGGRCEMFRQIIEAATASPLVFIRPDGPVTGKKRPGPTLKEAYRMVETSALELCPAFDVERIPELVAGDVIGELGLDL